MKRQKQKTLAFWVLVNGVAGVEFTIASADFKNLSQLTKKLLIYRERFVFFAPSFNWLSSFITSCCEHQLLVWICLLKLSMKTFCFVWFLHSFWQMFRFTKHHILNLNKTKRKIKFENSQFILDSFVEKEKLPSKFISNYFCLINHLWLPLLNYCKQWTHPSKQQPTILYYLINLLHVH